LLAEGGTSFTLADTVLFQSTTIKLQRLKERERRKKKKLKRRSELRSVVRLMQEGEKPESSNSVSLKSAGNAKKRQSD
jgi:hypothetical protein